VCETHLFYNFHLPDETIEKEQLMMIRVAGRSTALSFLMLIVTFFYIQPEVGEAFNLANDSRNPTNNENSKRNKQNNYNKTGTYFDIEKHKQPKSETP
jgi:hypothetical protein